MCLTLSRLKEELEWRDSGHGDDVDVADESDAEMIGADYHADNNVTLKNWTWHTTRFISISILCHSRPGDD